MQQTQETWVWFLGPEDPRGKEMTTHSSILAWKIPWTEEPGRLQSIGSQTVGRDWGGTEHTHRLSNSLPKNRVGKGKNSNSTEKPGQHYINQVKNANIISLTCGLSYIPWFDNKGTMVFFPQTHHFRLIIRKNKNKKT